VACFERDISGSLGLHRAEVVRYIRPEIIGFVLGSTLAALTFREFKARAGSAPLVRFILSMLAMTGALVFPERAAGMDWRWVHPLINLSISDCRNQFWIMVHPG